MYRTAVRISIVASFILAGLGGFIDPNLGAYRFIVLYMDPQLFGFVMFVSACVVAYDTHRGKRLSVLGVIPWFGYVGAIVGFYLTGNIYPLPALGAFLLSSTVIILETVLKWEYSPYAVTSGGVE